MQQSDAILAQAHLALGHCPWTCVPRPSSSSSLRSWGPPRLSSSLALRFIIRPTPRWKLRQWRGRRLVRLTLPLMGPLVSLTMAMPLLLMKLHHLHLQHLAKASAQGTGEGGLKAPTLLVPAATTTARLLSLVLESTALAGGCSGAIGRGGTRVRPMHWQASTTRSWGATTRLSLVVTVATTTTWREIPLALAGTLGSGPPAMGPGPGSGVTMALLMPLVQTVGATGVKWLMTRGSCSGTRWQTMAAMSLGV